ncbi:zinc ABC transporter substrate-binding protein [Bacillaceae bacterium IKA-2]|nr:zinc ABC transporter substrate-binding protein [Bacillaceae bacterium IKA-2]
MFNQKCSALLIFLVASIFLMVGCSAEKTEGEVENNVEKEGLSIVTSFSIVDNIVSEIIGDRGSTSHIVPVDGAPEEYDPINSDFQKVSDADVFFANGMGLEAWLSRVTSQVTDTPIVEVSDGIEKILLVGSEDEYDPHAWLDVSNIEIYVKNIVNTLIELDPEGETVYRENKEDYLKELDELHNWILEETNKIAIENKIIVISENAFKYYGDAYGFHTEGIWELNAHEEGTPGQISRVIDLVNDRSVRALFLEKTVDRRYMEQISTETGVEIAGSVYTDSISSAEDTNSYLKIMRANTEAFIEGLK